MSCQVWLIHCHTFNLSQGATCAYTHSLSVHQIVLLESVYLSALSVDLAENLPRCPEDTHHQTTTLLFCPQMALPLMYCPPISRSDDYFDQAPGELPLLVLRLSGSLKMPLPNYSCTLIFGNLTPPPNQVLPGITPLNFPSPLYPFFNYLYIIYTCFFFCFFVFF